MKAMNLGPNPQTIYKYMKSKGYTPDFKFGAGKEVVIFTKTLHSAEFPTLQCLKGLVVVHKIKVNIWEGRAHNHWLENRKLPINGWEYVNLLETLYKESIESYNKIKDWMKGGWLKS